jgi:hypothetical protein
MATAVSGQTAASSFQITMPRHCPWPSKSTRFLALPCLPYTYQATINEVSVGCWALCWTRDYNRRQSRYGLSSQSFESSIGRTSHHATIICACAEAVSRKDRSCWEGPHIKPCKWFSDAEQGKNLALLGPPEGAQACPGLHNTLRPLEVA